MSAVTATSPERRPDFETAVRSEDRLELRIWLRLLTCANLIERRVRQQLRDRFSLTLPRFDLLAQLDRAPQGLTMGELSRRLMVSNGNVTGLIDRLLAEGLVERAPAPDDRRVQVVRLTAAGKAGFDAMAAVHEGWIAEMMVELSRGEMAGLYALLAKLKRSVEHAEE
ncbi:MAG TPA: MarR family transcriptional regulator [Alphaproteobacteria bacterium]|nr:MarR family transcriptional regulator [Alphaproteobacteria bacterium]